MIERKTATERKRDDKRIDEELDESFPASDPPAYGGLTSGAPDHDKGSDKRG